MTQFRKSIIILAGMLFLSAVTHARRPNIILVMADDFGYEALACNGSTTYETPAFDRIASQGMRFTNAYSQPVCTPSRVKIMTGQSNARNYVQFGVLRSGEITFGNLLKDAGYKTAIAGKWQLLGNPNSLHKGTHWEEAGFEESCIWAYAHYLEQQDLKQYMENSPLKTGKDSSRYWYPSILENGKFRPTTKDDFGPDIYSEFVLDYIDANKDQEFFIYYPMALTHGPFVPTPHSGNFPEKDKYGSNTKYFADMVQYAGYILEKIIMKLDDAGIAENTLVLFTCDNGTGRGIVSWMGDRLVTGGKAFPVDAGTHVPFLAYWKGTIQPGSVCTDLIEFSDFVPTLTQLGNASLPVDRIIDGRSFLPQLIGEKGNPREAIVVHYDKDPDAKKPKFRRVRFAYDGRYKLYMDGRMFEIAQDYLEQIPLDMERSGQGARDARVRLQAVLDNYPEWQPDNSSFGDKPSKDFQKFLDLQAELSR